MDHWFDDLTRGLAQEKLSRRTVLRGVLTMGMASVGAALLGKADAGAQMALAAIGFQRRVGPCAVRREGQTLVFTFSARSTSRGRSLTLDQTTRKLLRRGQTTINRVIRLEGQTLLEINAIRRPGSNEVTITHGPAFHGVKRAFYRSTDGKLLQGEIDGRRLSPFRVGDDPRLVKFADGGPQPQMTVSSDILEAISSILTKSKQDAADCAARRAHNNESGKPLAHHAVQGQSGHDSYPEQSGECVFCKADCTLKSTSCAVAVATGCIAAGPFYCVCACSGLAACAVAEVICIADCHSTGEPCCPVECGDVACCESGEACLKSSTGICCSKGLVPCAGKHCCKSTDTCISATGFCCPHGQEVCKDICCAAGEVCKAGVIGPKVCCSESQIVCNGTCCPDNHGCVDNKKCCKQELMCGKVCCDELSRCEDASRGLCCSFTSSFCNGICCKPGEKCINGKCCSNHCGSVCCAPGQGCKDGKCISKKCRPGQVTCISSEGPDKKGEALCCPPKVSCCLGKCCKPDEMCCSGPGIAYGCHNPNLCIA